MLLMLTIDGKPAHCPTCGHHEFTDTGYDYLFRLVSMSRYLCDGCGQRWELHDIFIRQHLAPTAPATTGGPRVRATDPEPSHIAAQLPFDGRRQQVIDALLDLGRANADQITAWINARHDETQRSATSKRLGELCDQGAATRDGDHTNHRGRRVSLYRLTEIARRQAA